MFDILVYIRDFFLVDNSALTSKWKDVFSQMAVHTRKKKPVDLLLAQRPNEEPHIWQYRLDNYRAITYGSMNRALDSVGRILNKIQYSIVCDEVVKKYIEQKNFSAQATQYDFATYFEKIILKRDIEDPNGFLCWLPKGAGLTDSTKRVDPEPFLFYSHQLHDANKDVVSFISDEKVVIRIDDNHSIEGDVYYVITKDWFYKLVQKTAHTPAQGRIQVREAEFELVPIYKHDIGEIPVLVLGGDMNADGFFESYFAPYCAFGDEAITTFSDWQAIKVTSGYPYREEFYTECELRDINKKANEPNSKEEKYKSPQKKLVKYPQTPYNAIIRTPAPADNKSIPGAMGDRILPNDIPSIRFISPDIEVFKYTGESWEKLITKAEDALHLNLGIDNSNVSDDTTKRQKEEHYAMIEKIQNNYFSHLMLNSIKYIDCYLNRRQITNVTAAINRPSSSVIKTEADLIEEISDLTSSNVPPVFLAESVNELASKRFSGNPLSQKIFSLIPIIDPLYVYGVTQKIQMLASNGIQAEAYQNSIYAYPVLIQLANEITPDEFIKKDTAAIKALYDERIKQYLYAPLAMTDPAGNPI